MTRSCKKCGQITLEDGETFGCLCDLRKGSKYGNTGVQTDDGYFHSKGELARWNELVALQKARAILSLKRQQKIPLHAKGGSLVGYYIADFTYQEVQPTGSTVYVVEDYKGYNQIGLSQWKLRHFEAEYGIKVRISKKATKRKRR